MRVFIIFLMYGYLIALISTRPMVEGNESESRDAEYEESDESIRDEYLNEEQDQTAYEAPTNVNQEQSQQESQELNQNVQYKRDEQNKARYKLSDAEFADGKESPQDQTNLNLDNSNRFSLRNSNSKMYHNEGLVSMRNDKMRIDDVNTDSKRDSDYPSDTFYKINHENSNTGRGDYLGSNEQLHSIGQYYKSIQTTNKDIADRRKCESSLNSRDRRDISNLYSKKNSEDINENSESSILNDINKLSDTELENLLISLSENKKAVFQKIMDKREITKKAGAVDDNGSDTSKLEGGFSLESNTVSSVSTNADAADTNKQSEEEESSTKPQETENESGKSENKSGLDASTSEQQLVVNIEAVTSNVDSRNEASIRNIETLKNDNKREVNSVINKKDSFSNTKLSDDFDDKVSYDSSLDQDVLCSDSKKWIGSENDNSNTQKREISEDNSFADTDSMKSLEDSFPRSNDYEDAISNSEPLIRVKRTEPQHKVKKRDLSALINDKVPFVPGFENKDLENVEVSEFEDKNFLNNPTINVRSDREVKPPNYDLSNTPQHKSKSSDKTDVTELATDKSNLGSDTDNILSNIEGVDDNIMYSSKIRNKRFNENIVDEENNQILIQNVHAIAPIDIESNSKFDNSADISQYRQEPLGTISHKSDEYLNRSKRIKRVKNNILAT